MLVRKGILVLSLWVQFSPHTFIEGPLNAKLCARHVRYRVLDLGPRGVYGVAGWTETCFQWNEVDKTMQARTRCCGELELKPWKVFGRRCCLELNLEGLDRVRRWGGSVRPLKSRTTEACAGNCQPPVFLELIHGGGGTRGAPATEVGGLGPALRRPGAGGLCGV